MRRIFAVLGLFALLVSAVPSVASAGTHATIASSGSHGYTFDFRAVSLRGALASVAKRANIKLGPMPSVPDTGSLGIVLMDVRTDQAWAALVKPYGLVYVDDPSTGLRYVGTEAAMATQFPLSNIREVVALPFPGGDLSQSADIVHTLSDTLGSNATVFAERQDATVVIIGSPATIARAKSIFDAMYAASPTRSGQYVTQNFHLSYARADEASPVIRSAVGNVSAPNSLAESKQTNSFIVSGTPDFIERVRRVIANVDVAVPLMKLDVTVVAIQPNNDSSDVGFSFGGIDVSGQPNSGTGETTTLFLNKSVNVNATLDALVKKGRASVVSRGALYSRNNVEALIDSITTYPFISVVSGIAETRQIENFDAGATIKMTPTFIDSGMLVSVDATYSTLNGFSAEGVPIINKNHIKDDLLLKDDSALVVSGFFSDVTSDVVQKIPGLGDLPLFGGFFRNRQTARVRSEVAFIMVPHKGSEMDDLGPAGSPIGHPVVNLNIPLFQPTPTPTTPPVRPLLKPAPPSE